MKRAAEILGLDDLLQRKPRQLSGGQRQRVAMGRAIVGELQQVGPPRELFDRPRSVFVAGFIGSPGMNFATGKLERTDGGFRVGLGEHGLEVDRAVLEDRPALESYEGKEIILGIRPQDIEDAAIATDAPEGRRLKAKIDLVEHIGTETVVHFGVDAPLAVTEDMKELAADVGGEQMARLERKAKEGHNEFVGQLSPETDLSRGDTAELVVNTDRLHFFDPETNAGIYDGEASKQRGKRG